MNMSNMLDMFAGTYQYGWSSHMLQPHFSTAPSCAIFRLLVSRFSFSVLVSRLVFSRVSHFSFLVFVSFLAYRFSFYFSPRFSWRFWFLVNMYAYMYALIWRCVHEPGQNVKRLFNKDVTSYQKQSSV